MTLPCIGSQSVGRTLNIRKHCQINSTTCSHACCAFSNHCLSSLRDFQVPSHPASDFLLRASAWHKALWSALVPRRTAAQLGHRGTLWGRRKCQGSKQQAGTLQHITSRGYIEGLNQQCHSQGSSSDGQAAKWSWDLEGLGTLPPLKYKKANKGGLQGEGTFHSAYGSGREMEARR